MNMSVKIDVEKAASMWGNGITLENIAARFGAPNSTLKNIIRRNRDIFPKRERASVLRREAWTQERLEEAARMWRAGDSASIIGAKFGLDRKTICRLAFDHRDLFPRKTKAAMLANRKPSTPKQRQANVYREAAEFIADIEAEIPPTAFDAERLPHAKQLIDIQHGECKWPMNHGGPFLFCADATESGAYCNHHRLRSLPRHHID